MILFFFFAALTQTENIAGTWHGAIEIPGQPLQVEIELSFEEEKLKGNISIPAQGVSGMRLRCKQKKGSLTLAILKIPGSPLFKGKITNNIYTGEFTQGGASFPFRLERGNLRKETPQAKTLTPAVADHPALGHWEGYIHIPNQANLAMKMDFEFVDETYQGRAQFPSQTQQFFPLESIHFTEEETSFVIPSIPGKPAFVGRLKEGIISGNYTQGSLVTTFELKREKLTGPRRPQMPQAPFPYSSQDFAWTNVDITLAGTLTLPPGPGPHPAVILLSGSGSQDRDSTLFGHKPFWVIADALSRRGIAVLRYDDRGVGGSTPAPNSTTADFAKDAILGVRMLAKHPGIDAKRIGLVGHSEGGIIAPLAASQFGDGIAFIVSLAGTGTTGREILTYQLGRKLEVLYPAEKQAQFNTWLQQVLDITAQATDTGKARTEAEPIVAQMHAALPADVQNQFPLDAYQQSLALLFHRWTAWFMNHDPTQTLRQLNMPVLVMLCERDRQVTVAQNLEPIKTALKGNPKAEIRVMKGLNHLFQPAITGEGDEYSRIETTFDKAALIALGDWILAQTQTMP